MSYRFHCQNRPKKYSPKPHAFPANVGLPFGLQFVGSLVIKGRGPTNFNLPSLGGRHQPAVYGVAAIRAALETAGVTFLADGQSADGGPGMRLTRQEELHGQPAKI
ncbi:MULTISPECIES: hypothetical protein [Bradyrhizobium]